MGKGKEQLEQIRYLIVDVDGTMTDGGIYYDEDGNEWKKFNTKDAAGFFAAEKSGIRMVVLTGRRCGATAKRMKELGVEHLYQGVKDKHEFIAEFMKENGLERENIGYIGDDLNDLLPMNLAGFVACPSDGCAEVRKIADYVSPINGGDGVVRDVIEFMLRKMGNWDRAVEDVYGLGT